MNINILQHATKKPGCGSDIMNYFRGHGDLAVHDPCEVAVIGDRLLTDVMLANMMGACGIWLREGVVPCGNAVSHSG